MGNKFCTKCGVLLDEYNSRKRNTKYPDKIQSTCKLCHNEQTTFGARRYKLECMNAYGGPKCACCGTEEYEFLSIDHINGNGAEHRREIKLPGGLRFYLWLKRNKFPPGFRVLCMNCNLSLAAFGYCPHKEKSKVNVDVLIYSPRKVLTGEAVTTSKLKYEQVMEIRNRLAIGEKVQELANSYGVHKSQIYRILHNKNWAQK